MLPKSQDIETAFFLAMENGYAQSVPKQTVPGMPGSKCITFVWGDYTVVDLWFTTPHSDFSHGTTIIYFKSDAVWMMCYEGQYPKEIIHFLKHALHIAYVKEKRFYGGRGPSVVPHPDNELTYINDVAPGSSFKQFQGSEHIRDGGTWTGYHAYHGRLLIELPDAA